MRQLTILGTKKSIIQKATNPEILVYTDDTTVTQKSLDITGDKIVKYKHKLEIDGKLIKDYGTFDNKDVNESVLINDYLDSVKQLGVKNAIATVTALQDDGQIVTSSANINIYNQRNYSLQFDGLATSYVSITVPSGFSLTGKTVQVIVKPSGGSWSVRTDSGTFVTLTGTELTIGKSQNCIIDEVRIWETANVQAYNDRQLKGNEIGLVALYRFNEFLGKVAFDSSPNEYHGAIVGNVVYVNDRYLTQNVADAIITNDIANGVTILPKNSIHDYNMNIIAPETPSSNIMLNNKTQSVLDTGILYEYNINKTNWKKINGLEIVTLSNGELASKIVGNKKSPYNYDVKISEIDYNLKNVANITYDVVGQEVSVDTTTFTQAVTNYTNRITVNQEDGSVVTKDNQFLLYNNEPRLILGFVDIMNMFLQIGDDDNDRVKFKIEMNGKQFYPSTSEYTPLQATPIIFTKQLLSTEVLIGKTNIMKVYTKDEYEVESTHTINFVGQYCGLMFTDESGDYYSSDFGDILKRLDFGIITAGQTSAIKKVFFKNTTGYDITNVNIAINASSVPKNNVIKLSSQPDPFDSVDSISYSSVLKNGDQIPFFVRVKTQVLNSEDGTFVITANALPV